MLRNLFPQGHFASPTSEASIAAVETTLEVHFPEQLRALYLGTDEFSGDLGDASYLLPLTRENLSDSLSL
jgi:hypothetical protein